MRIFICIIVCAVALFSFATLPTFDQLALELNNAAQVGDSEQVEGILKTIYSDYYSERENIKTALFNSFTLARNNGFLDLANRLEGLYEVIGLEESGEEYEDYEDYEDSDEGDEDSLEDYFGEDDLEELPLVQIVESSTEISYLDDIEEICDRIKEGELPETKEENDIVIRFLREALRVTNGDLAVGELEIPPAMLRFMIEESLQELESDNL
jgi:hypothetical protein